MNNIKPTAPLDVIRVEDSNFAVFLDPVKCDKCEALHDEAVESLMRDDPSLKTTFSEIFPVIFSCKWAPDKGPPLYKDPRVVLKYGGVKIVRTIFRISARWFADLRIRSEWWAEFKKIDHQMNIVSFVLSEKRNPWYMVIIWCGPISLWAFHTYDTYSTDNFTSIINEECMNLCRHIAVAHQTHTLICPRIKQKGRSL